MTCRLHTEAGGMVQNLELALWTQPRAGDRRQLTHQVEIGIHPPGLCALCWSRWAEGAAHTREATCDASSESSTPLLPRISLTDTWHPWSRRVVAITLSCIFKDDCGSGTISPWCWGPRTSRYSHTFMGVFGASWVL
jgi:hypothetical protein